MLGSEIETLAPDALADLAETAAVFAKVSPSQKAAIIDALHRKGHVVGYLGDGLNDGPALKAADVGISVDSAVDIAKESADIILLEKSLAVLGEGVIEGRKVFGNITKYIKMGASSNFGNMFSVLGASIFLPFLPMTPIQVLTNNLLYDFSQTAIPTDNVDAEYLAVPRRWDIGNITKFMLLIGPISSIFDYVTYFLMLYVFNAWSNPALFQTGWFVESLLTQTLIIHIIRTAKVPFLQSRASAALITTSLIIASIGIVIPFTRLGHFLGFVRAAAALLDRALPDPPGLCRPHPSDEDLVHPPLRIGLSGGLDRRGHRNRGRRPPRVGPHSGSQFLPVSPPPRRIKVKTRWSERGRRNGLKIALPPVERREVRSRPHLVEWRSGRDRLAGPMGRACVAYACNSLRNPATGPKRSRLPMAAISSFALPSPRIGAMRSSALASTSLWSIGFPGVPRTS